MARKPPRASLLGLPVELRLHIYKHLFHDYIFQDFLDEGFLMGFYMYANLYSCYAAASNQHKTLSILATCRQTYKEAAELLYSHARLMVCIMGTNRPGDFSWLSPLGIPEKMHFWPYLRDLRLKVMLEKGKDNGRDILVRIRRFTEHVIGGGKFLRKLQVVFTTPDDEGLPSWYVEAVVALSVLQVKGDVSVRIEDDDGDDEECAALEEVITISDRLVLRS